MYVVSVPNRASPPAVLLRESYRENGKVKNRTLANLTDWQPERIEALRQILKNKQAAGGHLDAGFDIVSSRAHGNIAAVLGTLRKSGLGRELSCLPTPARALVEAMIVARLIRPRSKLALARELTVGTQLTTLADELSLGAVDEDALYDAMDALHEKQSMIEDALAKRHLTDGALVLYDLSSTYFEGKTCPLAKIGHSRDGKKNTLQIVFGVLATAEGCPVAVEVFDGNTGDPTTFTAQVKKVRERFGIHRVVFVGDRGMITDARIRDDLRGADGFSWITAMRAPAIQELVERKSLQLSLFDERDLAEITDDNYPGERLVVCKNPLLATERARKREDLLVSTEKHLARVRAATQRARKPLRGRDQIGLSVGKVLGRYKVAKHFDLTISDDGFVYARNVERIQRESILDGIYVIRTSVPESESNAETIVLSYKGLATVERVFRSMKSADLAVRPIHHRSAARVRTHVFLCLLGYYVEWHMRRALAPLLFQDDAKHTATRKSVVAPAQRSTKALQKAERKKTSDGEIVQSFRSLIDTLGTLTKNRVQPKAAGVPAFDVFARPTQLQAKALKLLGVSP